MDTIAKIINRLQRASEAIAKARVNSVLLGMGREKVEEYGYSFDALQLGPSAWPWRGTPQDGPKENDLMIPAPHFTSLYNSQTNDQGIAFNDIEKPVRHGRPVDGEQNAA
ncbi:MAG: hypothetical protein ACI9LO_002292 [Planctomycetota bacterium]|jgi:hypothetical protein